jgi:peptidoglycan/xylan/chitin deacetylase (PgdA/CDA1 family)
VSVKQGVVSVLAGRRVSGLFRPLMRGRCTIFMLHRFRAPDLGVDAGHEPDQLRRGLEVLRRRGYPFVSLDRIFGQLAEGEPPPSGAVAFTLDDGYREQALVAGPIFAAFDCPVTTFVTTGFLDRKLWFWWDRVAQVFKHTRRRSIEVELNDGPVVLSCDDVSGRTRAEAEFVARCKAISDQEKHAAIARLAAAADVELPQSPPPWCQPMTWDELRRAEASGMAFGPHTVTHPVLSRTEDDASRLEIEESWRRVKAEATRPVGVFCYPNGGWQDFGPREVDTLRALGFLGAVVGVAGFARQAAAARARFTVRRFPYPEDAPHLIQYVSGIERFKMLVRRMES